MDSPSGITEAGRDIYTVNFADYLPAALKHDPKIKAIAETVTKEALTVSGEIENVLIYSRIDKLSEALIDILAYDMHVDWYDYSFPLKVKRDILKSSVKVHKKMGTKYAVEQALGEVYPFTRIEEWFDYGGNPFYFRVRIDGEQNAQIDISDILKKIMTYKRMSAHLETICIGYRYRASIRYDPAVSARVRFWPRRNLEIRYLDGRRRLDGTLRLGGYAEDIDTDLYPIGIISRQCARVECGIREDSTAQIAVAADVHCMDHLRASLKAIVSHQCASRAKIGSELGVSVHTEGAYVTIHGCLDGAKRLDGNRRLDAGTYRL